VTPVSAETSWTNASYLTDALSAPPDGINDAGSESNRSESTMATSFALMIYCLVFFTVGWQFCAQISETGTLSQPNRDAHDAIRLRSDD
jgi:hypothetical protein